MHENIVKIFQARIANFIRTNTQYIYPEELRLTAEYARSAEPVRYQDRLSLNYLPAKEGMVWGGAWDSAWFHLTGTVPAKFEGYELCYRIHTGGESLVFDTDGNPIYGLTGFSVFNALYYKDRYVPAEPLKPGMKIDLWVEAAANGLFGITQPAPEDPNPAHLYGDYKPEIKLLRLSVFHRELWSFLLDLKCLESLMNTLGTNDYRAKQLLHTLNKALDLYNDRPERAAAAREILRQEAFCHTASSSALTAHSIGHAHIDVGWLWPVCESTRKAARTFSSQLALMEKYPDYKFGASQAYLYEVVKENYPVLYRKIAERIREGRWEVQGGMFVEADCNLISGESMARQFLYAKNFFHDEFGVDVRNLWLPDVFGYSASTPQIMKQAGCDYFLTQKISWSQVNRFPHHTFRWVGVDGSEVLTHFLPENDYNADASPEHRKAAQDRFNEAGYLPGFMSLIGIGDGGGGPSEEYVERNHRVSNLEGCPKADFQFASQFFNDLEQYRPELPVWKGELYLEFHRGTLTTQAKTKRGNRKAEQALAALEFIASALPAEQFPRQSLDKAWKTLLLNQFHDIIPGSSIHLVYQRTEREHAEILATAAQLTAQTCAALFEPDSDAAVLVNTLSSTWRGRVELPADWENHAVLDEHHSELPSQNENGRRVVLLTIPGSSVLTINKGQEVKNQAFKTTDTILENELIRYEFDQDGRLIHAYDKQLDKEFLAAPANVLSLYNDRPNTYEAWDIELFYPRDFREHPKCVGVSSAVTGPVGGSLELLFRTADSEIRQTVQLQPGSRRLDFITHVDWHEKRTLLRTAFPVTVSSDSATFDIQYAYLRRSTLDNTSWEEAQFEVCGHRYADLSDHECGVALLNDCKYGYRVKGNTLDLALLRSPKHPDYTADQGEHNFTYSFLPHCGTLVESDVMAEAAALNRAPILADGLTAGSAILPCRLESEGISLEVVKRAQKDDSLILRLVETKGKHSTGTLSLNVRGTANLSLTNLLEWEHGEAVQLEDGKAKLRLKPFEIRTLRLEF